MDVDLLLGKQEGRVRILAQGVRRVVRKAIPHARELVKWGNPTYEIGGGNVACMMLYKDHVNLGFFEGAKLMSGRLEGTGKGLRHIKVRRPEDIDEGEFSKLLKEAAALAMKRRSS